MNSAPVCACDPTRARRLEIRGVTWIASSFLVCPCHLPLTLWLVGSVAAGTALAPWLATHRLLTAALLTALWVAGTAYGIRQLRTARRQWGGR